MSRVFIPLEDIRVASPCHADWEMMDGNERVKLCGSCQKNVYNLSEMTRFDAEELIAQHEGNLCVRYYQRADGTILTQDCPVGLAKARRALLTPLKWVLGGVSAVVAWSVLAPRATTGTPTVVSGITAATPSTPVITAPRRSAPTKKTLPPRPHATPARNSETVGWEVGEMIASPVQGAPLPFNSPQVTNKRPNSAQRARATLQKLLMRRKAVNTTKR